MVYMCQCIWNYCEGNGNEMIRKYMTDEWNSNPAWMRDARHLLPKLFFWKISAKKEEPQRKDDKRKWTKVRF